MKTLSRIEKVQRTLRFIELSLEVADFISHSRISRAVADRIDVIVYGPREPWQKKAPASISIKSERLS